jgi:hypothetical protein
MVNAATLTHPVSHSGLDNIEFSLADVVADLVTAREVEEFAIWEDITCF